MCWICAKDSRTSITQSRSSPWNEGWNEQVSLASLHFDKLTIAFPIDGVGDLKPPVLPQFLVTTDNVPDLASDNNPTLTVTPPGTTTFTVSSIDTIGDQDFYKVTLIAGTTYELGLYSFNGGPNSAGLTDPYMELYAADGTTLLVSADGGADTPYNDINSGFDVLLVYTPTTSGTFYVNARAFGNTPLTPTGDSVGDYQLFAREQDPNDPTVYRPYYEPTEPLYALDWGSQVNKINQSVRNPDGDEGTRNTGNAPGTPTYNVNNVAGFDLNAILTANNMSAADIAGKNVITIYFARAGDIFPSNDPTQPGLPPITITAVGVQQFERDAVFTALGEFEKVADVIYLEVDSRDHADFIYTSYQGTPGPGVSLLGSMSPPDESDEGLAQFNSGDERWNATNLQQGGFSFVTLIHEFGHGHGLAHPHDNGGRSGIMNGVVADGPVADYTLGDYNLNQAVFTMMSYQDGWPMSPYGNAETDVGYGYLGGLMAFDIAAIQDKYGVNEETATGDDTYMLKDINAAGTYYSSIWDGGGTDEIAYVGSRDTTIDLRAASLLYENGGGGWVSYAYGIFGGFTIANGVTIENARSGAGNDILIGNAVANILTGGLGNDWYYVNGGDTVIEGAAEGTLDRVFASTSYTLTAGAYIENLATDFNDGTAAIDLTGNELDNLIYGNAGDNRLDGRAGADAMIGWGGNDWYFVDNAGDYIRGESASDGTLDRVFASASFVLTPEAHIEILSTDFHAGTASINLSGNALGNLIYGNAGSNVLDGRQGSDTLVGFGGDDFYFVDNAGDSIVEGASEGTGDRVFASTSYTLTAGAHIEIFSTDFHAGTAAINLTGNALGNSIYGNAGNNVVDGKGGSDALFGFGGADTFAFSTAPGVGNVDTIVDFDSDDTVALDDAVFAGLGLGALSANAFTTGTQATTADHRIVYDQATGNLFYDADGNGGGAAVLFANLQGAPVLTASDFTVI